MVTSMPWQTRWSSDRFPDAVVGISLLLRRLIRSIGCVFISCHPDKYLPLSERQNP